MYWGVPITTPVPVIAWSEVASIAFAMPKSMRRTWRVFPSIIRFSGLMSRWTTPASCAAWSASAASRRIRRASGTAMRPSRASTVLSVSPRTSGIRSQQMPSASPTS